MLYAPLQSIAEKLSLEFDLIDENRKQVLAQIAGFVQDRIAANQKANLNFICTHNSRRSHISQLWAQAAAHYYSIENVNCFSGGTEATAFNPRSVKALREAGFKIDMTKEGGNPVYEVHYAENAAPVIAFSKKYNDQFNPQKDFAAIMTCSHADENCPLVVGASVRISTPFNDPKEFDGTPQEPFKYMESVHLIGREVLYAFSKVEFNS
ncbi:MAG: protein-tyrosine-phosphatase [Cyclobacteriaceae bacterium]|jgi:arsenate reductase (thioredoxin)